MAMSKTQVNKLQHCLFFAEVKGFFPSLQAIRPKYVQNGNKTPKKLELSPGGSERDKEEILPPGQ